MKPPEALPERIGRYLIRGEIGRGAMGAVYDAVDPELDRAVAVKVIDPDPRLHRVEGDELAARFVREARLAARITHPGVVTVHDAGRDGGRLFLVMERVVGQPLSEALASPQRPGRATAIELVAQAAEALAAAHDLGVIHRDVKPSNLLVTADGRLKVSDFGVAKAIGEDTGLTMTGGTVGSPAYMAPEQVKGEKVDGRADLFSLGVVLYELLLGRRPFAADTITTLVYQILHHDPLAAAADLSRLGDGPAAVLRACLAKDPAQRVPDGRELARRLRALVTDGEATAVAPLAAASTAAPTAAVAAVAVTHVPPPRRRPGWHRGGLGLAAAAIVVAAVVIGLVRGSGTAPPASPPTAALPATVPVTPAATVTPGTQPEVAPPAADVAPSRPPAAKLSAPAPLATRAVAAPAMDTPRPTHPPPTPPVAEFLYTRSGIEFDVEPEDATIAVDGSTIGIAARWDGSDGGVYRFRETRGVHYVEISAPGYRSRWIRITVTPVAEDDSVEVEAELLPQ